MYLYRYLEVEKSSNHLCFTVSFGECAASEWRSKILALLCSSCCIVMKLVLNVYSKIKFVALQRTLNSYVSAWVEKLAFFLTRTPLVCVKTRIVLSMRTSKIATSQCAGALSYDKILRLLSKMRQTPNSLIQTRKASKCFSFASLLRMQ